MPPQQQSQYDFILNNSPKPPRGPLVGGNKIGRILVVVVGLLLLIIAGVAANNFLKGSDKEQNQRLIDIAKAQTEIIRVSALVKPETAKDLDTRIFALNTRLSLEGSNQQIKTLLAARGVNKKSLTKIVAPSKNPKTDGALDEATKNNRFDETYLTIIEKQLSDYQILLKAAAEAGNTKEKQSLTASFNNVDRLSTKLATRPKATSATSVTP